MQKNHKQNSNSDSALIQTLNLFTDVSRIRKHSKDILFLGVKKNRR